MGIPKKVADARYAKTVYLDVRRYVPPGEVLTQANFQDALEDALADAVTLSSTPVLPFPGAQINACPRYQVLVPEGAWWLTRTVVIPSTPATTTQPFTPGITGADEHGTLFFVDSNTFTATNNAVFNVGGDNGDDYVYGLLLEKFGIYSHGGVSHNLDAITVTLSLWAHIRDVTIFGFQDGGSRPNRGWAIKLLDTGTGSNNQYPKLTNLHIAGCSGGVYAEHCLYLGVHDVYSRQNLQWDCVFSGSVVSLTGGSVESAMAPVGSPYRCSKGIPKVVTGWNIEVATGTGASVGTASGDVTTVSGLSGLDRDNDTHRWLYLEKSSGAYDGTDKVSGYYLITKVLSATSCEIRKGSSHSATGSLIWKTCEATQVDLQLDDMTYHEGDLFAGIGLYVTTGGAGSCKIGNCNMANCDYTVETLGNVGHNALSVKIDGAAQSSYFVKARVCPSIVCLDATDQSIGDVDEYSREGLVMRERSYTYGSITTYAPLASPGPLRTSMLPAGDARTMCRFGGANALWDARVESSFVKSGADVTSWTDLIGGVVAGLTNATKYPQYSASDARFNNFPSVTFTGGSAANTCALNATIPQASWVFGQPTVVAVIATAIDTLLPSGTYSRIRLVQDGLYDLSIFFLEDLNGTPAYGGGVYPPNDNQQLAQTPDLEAHVFIMGGGGRSRPRISSEAGTRLMSNFISPRDEGWVPGNTSLRFQDPTIGASSTFSCPFCATFPHGLSYAAREQLLDQLAREFGIARLA